jgi:hypothetical protein
MHGLEQQLQLDFAIGRDMAQLQVYAQCDCLLSCLPSNVRCGDTHQLKCALPRLAISKKGGAPKLHHRDDEVQGACCGALSAGRSTLLINATHHASTPAHSGSPFSEMCMSAKGHAVSLLSLFVAVTTTLTLTDEY